MTIRHAFTSLKPASADASLVDGPKWNDNHIDDADQALVWDDLQCNPQNATGGTALTVVVFRNTNARVLAFADNALNHLTFTAQMPHAWDPATAVNPHVHWVPLVAPAAARVVRFVGAYVWARPNQIIPAVASWTTVSPVDVTINPGDEFKALITPLVTVSPPANAEASDILFFVLSRDGGSASDTYNDGVNNVGLLSFDVHYQKKSLNGTVVEY